MLSVQEPSEEIIKKENFDDRISLPSTVSQAGKSPLTGERSAGYLTDPRAFQGYALYRREISFAPDPSRDLFLILEKTRVSTLYINGKKVGRQDSLCTPHRYDITDQVSGDRLQITLAIDNVSCPVPGGHMTSPDTQTNWLGILGGITLLELPRERAEQVRIFPDIANHNIRVTGRLLGCRELAAVFSVNSRRLSGAGSGAEAILSAPICDPTKVVLHGETDGSSHMPENAPAPKEETVSQRGESGRYFSFTIPLENVSLWSEHSPVCCELLLEYDGVKERIPFGLRQFFARGTSLYCSDTRIFLRGKHDGMVFPLTGAAPMDLSSWLKVMGTAKEYGINHYRFHTCCPPEAAFEAADLLGIYLAPELPFWGTVEEERTPAQEYLVQEGFRILDQFGSHPSFFGFSLGNELWGSQKVLDQILADYKAYDNRHLYTQGSNNFQFVPAVLEHEDYFVGVRFSKERLFRGSYAMCDAPLGHIQTQAPNSDYDYDEMIRPGSTSKNRPDTRSDTLEEGASSEGTSAEEPQKPAQTMEIQYGTGVKTVTLTESHELVPPVPVISHEIGQYFFYPDYREIQKYTGVLKPCNLEIFQERLEKAGLGKLAEDYFYSSGQFAADCYKMELETALRSKELAGFQLLDLQDFPGQGTALVGILNAFMENKGILSRENWREFCNDRVLLGCLPSFVYAAGNPLQISVKYYTYTGRPEKAPRVRLSLLRSANSPKSEEALASRTGSPESEKAFASRAGSPESEETLVSRAGSPEPEEALVSSTGSPEPKEALVSSAGSPESEEALVSSAVIDARETLGETIQDGVFDLGKTVLSLPETKVPCRLTLRLELEDCPSIRNHYFIWVYPQPETSHPEPSSQTPCVSMPTVGDMAEGTGDPVRICREWHTARECLSAGKRVLFLPRIPAPQNPPDKDAPERFVPGTYCTDFWNYPMFRSISESVGRPWPVGTLGLLIDPRHPALRDFPTETYSTPQWYDIVTDAPAMVLDGTGLDPILRTIDNCERNHNMGILWEAKVLAGSLLVCTSPLDLRQESLPCRQLLYSLLRYLGSADFAPETATEISWLDEVFGENT